eukprot:3821821-Rhodomonas_salina.2
MFLGAVFDGLVGGSMKGDSDAREEDEEEGGVVPHVSSEVQEKAPGKKSQACIAFVSQSYSGQAECGVTDWVRLAEPAAAESGGKKKKKRITTPYMTKYERARVLGTRALQISMNAPVLVRALLIPSSQIPKSQHKRCASTGCSKRRDCVRVLTAVCTVTGSSWIRDRYFEDCHERAQGIQDPVHYPKVSDLPASLPFMAVSHRLPVFEHARTAQLWALHNFCGFALQIPPGR